MRYVSAYNKIRLKVIFIDKKSRKNIKYLMYKYVTFMYTSNVTSNCCFRESDRSGTLLIYFKTRQFFGKQKRELYTSLDFIGNNFV